MPMKKFAVSLVLAASLGLAACGGEKATETNEVAVDNGATDLNLAADEAIGDVNAAAADALNSADLALENAGEAVENAGEAVDNAGEAVAETNAL
jgi:predicted small secreted protein